MLELLPLIALFVIMYLLMIRPQQQRLKRQRALIESLAVGDEVVTAGGLVGVVRVIDDGELRVEAGPGVEVRVLRGAITRRVEPTDAPTDPGDLEG